MAGTVHGRDVLLEAAARLQVLQDGCVAVPGIYNHRVTSGLKVVFVVVIVA